MSGDQSDTVRRAMRQPLEGIRVLDLSRVLAGPYCTMVMGDLGAEVIKVESPEGDDTRRWGPPYKEGESAYYLSCNRNKRGVVLNLRTEEGRDIARQLALKSDVLVENFRPGVVDELGLSHTKLRQDNPRLIYCSISAYGASGPNAGLPGYDYVMQGESGLMSITGEPDGPPTRMGVAVTDLATGLFTLSAILAALRARDLTGEGQHIDMAMFDVSLAMLVNVGSGYLVSGEVPARYGSGHPNLVPYQTFRARDGDWVILAIGNDGQWRRFCQAVDWPDLADDARFLTNADRIANRAMLAPILEEIFLTRAAGEWLALLEDSNVPGGPVNTVDRALNSPQAHARAAVEQVPHPLLGVLPQVASPLRLESTPPSIRRHPPLLGEHTDEVLAEVLDIRPERIAALKALGAIG